MPPGLSPQSVFNRGSARRRLEEKTAAKFAVDDRVRINEKTFPSYDEGLFNSLPKTGHVVKVEPASILPYQVKIDGFQHHPFWFYEDQLLFEDTAKEAAWAKAHAPPIKSKVPTAPKAEAASH